MMMRLHKNINYHFTSAYCMLKKGSAKLSSTLKTQQYTGKYKLAKTRPENNHRAIEGLVWLPSQKLWTITLFFY